MGLTREQYNRIMRVYQNRRINAQHDMEKRQGVVYDHVPAIRDLSYRISQTAVSAAEAEIRKNTELSIKLKHEIEELSAKKRKLLTDNGYSEDYLDMHYECELCRDTGYINNEKCGCLKKLESELIYAASGLPVILRKENFESFDLSVYDNEVPIRKLQPKFNLTQRSYMANMILPRVKNFVDEFDSAKGRNILMTGPTGVGKTFLSNCIAKAIIDKCHTVLYLNSGELFDLLSKNSFSYESDEIISGKIDEIYDCDLLIIDDLGTELSSGFTNSKLFMLISHRLLHNLSTIISSNLSLNNIGSVYGDRIASRFMENYINLPFYGADLRLKGGKRK